MPGIHARVVVSKARRDLKGLVVPVSLNPLPQRMNGGGGTTGGTVGKNSPDPAVTLPW